VVADIHGCLNTFKAIVEKRIELTKEDQLFLLGDYINRGNNSAGVIEYIIDLIQQQYQLFPLRGNHEQMLLDAWQYNQNVKGSGEQIPLASRLMGAYDLLDESGELQEKYAQFLAQLPYYYELDKFYLVHAGFNFKAPTPFTDYSNMVWISDIENNPTTKTIIHGHKIKELYEIEHKVNKRDSIIALDNGCYYGLSPAKVKHYEALGEIVGNLCGLNVDTFELIVQPNVD
jgi:serine/threonine protein phosphatase 1